MKLEESLGYEEHLMSSEDVEVEVEPLVFFIVDRLHVCESDAAESSLRWRDLGQPVEDEVDLPGRHLAVVEVGRGQREDGLAKCLRRHVVYVIPLEIKKPQPFASLCFEDDFENLIQLK